MNFMGLFLFTVKRPVPGCCVTIMLRSPYRVHPVWFTAHIGTITPFSALMSTPIKEVLRIIAGKRGLTVRDSGKLAVAKHTNP